MMHPVRSRFGVTIFEWFGVWVLTCLLGASAFAADSDRQDVIGYMGVGRDGPGVWHALGFINPDGTGESKPELGVLNQTGWVFGPQFSISNQMLVTSFEESDLTKIRSGRAKTHNWIFDRTTVQMTEILQKDRPADLMRVHALLSHDTRVIVSGIIGGEERLFVMNLGGGEQVVLTKASEGFHYGLALATDQRRLALHVTGGKPASYNPGPYSINVLDLTTGKRVLVAGQPGHLYFGPKWSPDERQLAYLDCLSTTDPEHFRAAICVGQADGTGNRVITPVQTHWFDTTFGSNMTEWSPDGKTVTYTRFREDSDHSMKHGGAQICLVYPSTGEVTELTSSEPDRWDYRPAWSPDGSKLAFTRIQKGATRELWIMNADGSDQRRLTRGYQDRGADFAKWLHFGARSD